ncbi:MAG: hypothetical protein P8Z49_00090 [Acidobacteriota bacterium]|jgi:rubrerythrin
MMDEGKTFFRQIEDIEKKMAKLYEAFSRRFANDSEASAFFYRMSSEEKSHATQVQYQRRVLRQNPSIHIGTKADAQAVRDLSSRIDRINIEALSLEEALLLAIELEQSDAERNLSGQEHPHLGKLMSSMALQDKRHVEALETFAASRGVSLEGSRAAGSIGSP